MSCFGLDTFFIDIFKYEYITEPTWKLTFTFCRSVFTCELSVREEKIKFYKLKCIPSEDFLSCQPQKSLTQLITLEIELIANLRNRCNTL